MNNQPLKVKYPQDVYQVRDLYAPAWVHSLPEPFLAVEALLQMNLHKFDRAYRRVGEYEAEVAAPRLIDIYGIVLSASGWFGHSRIQPLTPRAYLASLSDTIALLLAQSRYLHDHPDINGCSFQELLPEQRVDVKMEKERVFPFVSYLIATLPNYPWGDWMFDNETLFRAYGEFLRERNLSLDIMAASLLQLGFRLPSQDRWTLPEMPGSDAP